MLNAIYAESNKLALYAECCRAECRSAMTNVLAYLSRESPTQKQV